MKEFRAAIIGLGRIGFEQDAGLTAKYVLSYARAFSLHKGFKLACGFDINRRKLDAFRNKYKVPAYLYKDLKINLKNIDVVVISVPIKDHFRVFKRVVSCCKPRMIIMEKPIASNLRQAKEILLLSRKNKTLLYVNYFRRVDPGINNLKQGIKNKQWGRLRCVNIYYGQGLLNNGSHFIDLIIYLLGIPRSIRVSYRRDMDNPNFVFCYKQLCVYFNSSGGLDYHLKEMDFIFEKARVRYLSLPQTQLMLPKKESFFGVKELIGDKDKSLYLDLERFMANVAGHIYDVLSGRGKLASTGQTALDALEVCYDIMMKEVAR